jgi:hypothetical protein
MSSGPVSSPSLFDGSVLSQRISKFSGSNPGAVHEPILPPMNTSGREGRCPLSHIVLGGSVRHRSVLGRTDEE